MEVTCKKDIVVVRKHIVSTAQAIEMGRMKETELQTAATELLVNMVRYAGSGIVTVETIEDKGHTGIRASFEDKGPGIADLEAALSKGFSTGKSLGHGLPGCKNLVDQFEIESTLGKGTRVVITKWN